MAIYEIQAKSILRTAKKIDSWFISHYNMNLYRGCLHNCVYCDGRTEKYNVTGSFGENVTVKVNAIDILSRELNPRRKRKPFKHSFVMVGGGVGDSYQPVESTFFLTRQALQLLYEGSFPVHVLTKSSLVMRDIDILQKINMQKRAIISFSFSSLDAKISSILEPGVPPPNTRISNIKNLKEKGIPCGMFLLPVIPNITDSTELIEKAIQIASEMNIDFVIFGILTLKEGRQKEYFMRKMENHYPNLAKEYRTLYRDDQWGRINEEYYQNINRKFSHIAKTYKIPIRIPPKFFLDILTENDRVIVILEHIDYLLRSCGKFSPYGRVAHEISKLSLSLSTMKDRLNDIKGVGNNTGRIIQDILEKGSCSLYDRLLVV